MGWFEDFFHDSFFCASGERVRLEGSFWGFRKAVSSSGDGVSEQSMGFWVFGDDAQNECGARLSGEIDEKLGVGSPVERILGEGAAEEYGETKREGVYFGCR